ncbi:hypothetical protein FRB93_008266 [Tulasnella sp. JGI-2019a]|nr:hypothetical protein FRB93_008266 [Tulasnella sp. JGI-2019a]
MRISAGTAMVCFFAMPLVVPRPASVSVRPFIEGAETEAAMLEDIARRFREGKAKYKSVLPARVERKQLAAQAKQLSEQEKWLAAEKAQLESQMASIKSLQTPLAGNSVTEALVAEVDKISKTHPSEDMRAWARNALDMHEMRNDIAIEQVTKLGSRADAQHRLRVKELLTRKRADQARVEAAVMKLDRNDETRRDLERKLARQRFWKGRVWKPSPSKEKMVN